jgi:ribonucleoside-diphosphate reductase alpha chain
MSTARLEAVITDSKHDISMQPASEDIWDKKYRLKTKQGVPLDADIDGTYQRVAKALADAETSDELKHYWQERFLWGNSCWAHHLERGCAAT